MRKVYLSIILLGLMINLSCSDDYTKTDQNSSFSDEKIEKLVQFPEAAMLLSNSIEAGGYNTMRASNIGETGSHEDFGQKSIDITMDAMGADMVFGTNAWFVYHYTYQMRVENMRGTKMHYFYYAKLAHNANLVIQSVSKLNPNFRKAHVYGRALALRAFANFNLVRVLSDGEKGIAYEYVDLEDMSKLKLLLNRVPTKDVYEFIEKDLLTAYTVLQGFSNAGRKGQVDQNVVSGMLSRMYLHLGNWNKAKEFSLNALNGDLSAIDFDLLNDGFSDINNSEVMWGSDIDGSSTTIWASFFSHMDTQNEGYGAYNDVPKRIDARLYAQISSKDARKNWFYDGKKTLISPSIGDTITPKNCPILANLKFVDKTKFTGDYVYMRKSEMLLNYAEAAYEGGDESEARRSLEVLMKSRLKGYSASGFSGPALRKEIRIQRRIELWGEGFAFPDIIRWNEGLDRSSAVTVGGVLIQSTHGFVPGTKFDLPAGSERLRLQFPIAEINANKELRPQNP